MKEEIKGPIFHLLEKDLIHVAVQGRLDMLLVRNVDKLAEPDSFVDALAQIMVGRNALIKPVAQFVKHHMEEIDDFCGLERMLERQEITERSDQQKGSEGIPLPPAKLPPESECTNNRKSCCKIRR